MAYHFTDMEALQASNIALKEATARLQEAHEIVSSRLQTPKQNITIQHITNLICLMKDECLHDLLAHFTSMFQMLSLLTTARRFQGGDDTSTDTEFTLRKLSEVVLCLRSMFSPTAPECGDDSTTEAGEAEDLPERPVVLEGARLEGLASPVIPLVDIKKALLEYQRSSDDLLVEVFLYSRLLKIMQAMKTANESKKSRRKTVRFTSPRKRKIPPQESPSPQIKKNDVRQASSSSRRRSMAEPRERKRNRPR